LSASFFLLNSDYQIFDGRAKRYEAQRIAFLLASFRTKSLPTLNVELKNDFEQEEKKCVNLPCRWGTA
jgi:hypothetical protein